MIESYLTGIFIVCMIRSTTFPPVKLQSGVGEGSMAGPLFFVAKLSDVNVMADRSIVRLVLMTCFLFYCDWKNCWPRNCHGDNANQGEML